MSKPICAGDVSEFENIKFHQISAKFNIFVLLFCLNKSLAQIKGKTIEMIERLGVRVQLM